jgi:hypothetical protein
MESAVLEIIDYQPEHQPWFEKFNRHWIEKHFWMEPIDVEVLRHPESHILKREDRFSWLPGKMSWPVPLR